jgi:uncharacterized protein (DUF58 family)
MTLTKKGVAYLVIAYFFIGLSLVLRETALTAFVIPTALLLVLSSHVPEAPDLKVARRICPRRSFGDEDIDVSVEIYNNSDEMVNELEFEDQTSEQLNVDAGTRTLTTHIRPHERVEFSYRISAPRRGNYVLGPILLRRADVMQFHEYKSVVPIRDEVTVMPKIEKLGPIALRARRVGQWPGVVPSRRTGLGTEFFESRPYEPGDELRRINWKASAKVGVLMTNEFEGEQVTDVLVVVDGSEGTLSRLFDFDVAEFELSLAASLCSQLINQGNRVGLSVYSAVRTWVDPGFGKRHLLRLLNGLAVANPGRASIPLQYAVESVIVSMVAAKSVVAFISPLMDDQIVQVIANLAARGYEIMCFTPAASVNSGGMTQPQVLARKILTLERRVKMAEVAEVARLIEFSPQLDLRHELRRSKPRQRA